MSKICVNIYHVTDCIEWSILSSIHIHVSNNFANSKAWTLWERCYLRISLLLSCLQTMPKPMYLEPRV